MPALMKGQKADITKNNPSISDIVVGMGWKVGANIDVDFSAFLLRSDGKVSGDADLIFYGNPRSTNGSVLLTEGVKSSFGGNIDREQVLVGLKKMPHELDRISFTLTIHEGEAKKQNFSQVDDAYIRVVDASSGNELLRYDIGKNFSIETAIVIGDLYKHNGEWKFSAIGSGYSGGLTALCGRFGIELQNEEESPPLVQSKSEVASAQSILPPQASSAKPLVLGSPPPANSAPAATVAPISLSKISLTKGNDVINLQKNNELLGEIVINLNWNRQKGLGGFLKHLSVSSPSSKIDLDLACMYEMKDGSIGVVQALGNRFGSNVKMPYISLDGDDRTGAVTSGENLRINGNKIDQIKRILIYTFIYDGVTKWSQADGIVTIKQLGGPDIEVRLDEHNNRKTRCAIALIENVNDQTFSIRRLVKYFNSNEEIDRAYNWGLRWTPGRK